MISFNDAANYRDLAVFECGKEICVKNKAISLTKKSYHLFHYVTDGSGLLILNNKEYRLVKGTIFFIPKETDAVYCSSKEDPWSYEWIGFYGERIDEILSFLNIDINNPIIKDTNRIYKQHFDDLVSRYTNKGFLDIYAIGALFELLGEMLYLKGGKDLFTTTKVTIQLAKDYMNNNYQFDISINDVAKNANVTPNYLSNIFRKVEKMSTKQYLIKLRMEKAMSFLKTGRFQVKEVSEMVGYSNQLHFSNEFKKYYGKSPINYLGGKKDE